jgi:hypothetical protein
VSCGAAEHELVPFLAAGTLAEEERAGVRAHVETCSDCREELQRSQELVGALRQLHLSSEEVVAAAWGDVPPPSHLRACSRCRDEVALVRRVNEGLRDAGSAHRFTWGLAAAAAVVVAVGVLLVRTPERTPALSPLVVSPPPRPRAEWRPDVAKPPVRLTAANALSFRRSGSSDAFLTAFAAAIEPYRRDDFAAVAQRLEAVRRDYPRAAEPAFYQGVSLLLAGLPERAVEALEAARQEETFADDATWYLAIAYARSARTEEARTALAALCGQGGAHDQAACAGLRALEAGGR